VEQNLEIRQAGNVVPQELEVALQIGHQACEEQAGRIGQGEATEGGTEEGKGTECKAGSDGG
jgi:hypothetical protein